MSAGTVQRWLREGLLAGEQSVPGAHWRIVLSEEVRRRLSGGDAPAGWVGLTEAARRLGLGKSHVVYWSNKAQRRAHEGREPAVLENRRLSDLRAPGRAP